MNPALNLRLVSLGVAGSLLGAALAGCASSPTASRNPWSELRSPTRGQARSIGSTSAGCLAGAASLPPDGQGYQLMRLSRGRAFGHPRMIAFLQALGHAVRARTASPALIGDIGMPRGGPFMSGHASHQTGLDVDIWFYAHPDAARRSLTVAERETAVAVSVVAPGGASLDEVYWDEGRHPWLLQAAAELPGVDRIFVNAAIKKHLCSRLAGPEGGHPAWLGKLRPWYGHDDHFHVRLSCTPGDAACVSQVPVPEGAGCDSTLDWWFTDEARAKGAEPAKEKSAPRLPAECAGVLASDYHSDRAAFPEAWFRPVPEEGKPAWEILPQEAGPGEVILSKRNELGLLSNFAATPFEFRGKRYASLEGFWQMMLYPEGKRDPRRKAGVEWKHTRDEVAAMVAFDAKKAGQLAEENMKKLGIDWVTFEGRRFTYRTLTPGEHYRLIVDAMKAKLSQNPRVREVLQATQDLRLRPDHHPEPESPPEWRYFDVWMQLRGRQEDDAAR